MHIDNMGEFEGLVHDIKCPLLIFFVTRWTKNAIDWNIINQYKKNINIISIDVGNIPELVTYHHLNITPSVVLYKDGYYKARANGFSLPYIKELVQYYGDNNE